MRHRHLLLPVLGLLLLGGASARGGTLTSATWFQVTSTGIGTSVIVGVPMTRTVGQLAASGTSTANSIAVSLSYPAFATTVFVEGTILDYAVQVTQGGPQLINATSGMGGGTPGIPGTLIVMTAAHAVMGVDQSMFRVGAITLVQVPLGHGKAGQFTGTFLVLSLTHQITVDFYAWTPGTFLFTGLTSKGNPLPDVSAMGSFNITSHQAGGWVTLVAPSKVSIDGTLAYRRTASFTKLALTFVPEPSALLLLLGGAGLAFLGGARRRPSTRG